MIKVKVNNEYKDVVKIFCGGTLQKEIVKVWSREAQEYVYESSVEYTGSLPITINTNGDALLDYRIYGADGGVGEPTENLCPDTSIVSTKYYTYSYTLLGTLKCITADENYKISWQYESTGTSGLQNKIRLLTAQGSYIKELSDNSIFSLTDDEISKLGNVLGYFGTDNTNGKMSNFMLTKGSTAPAEYVPFGYKLPMTVGNGDTTQTVPIYIGESQLAENEYVDYGEQKIYRDVSGTLTPTDPLVPLPEIPTLAGTTVIDYDGAPKPSQMYVKYRR